MKQKNLLIPIVAVVMTMLMSCVPAPSKPSEPDTKKIVEEIRSSFSERLAENIQEKMSEISSSVNDTLFSVNAAGDTVRAVVSNTVKSAPLNVTVEGLTIEVKSASDSNYYNLERSRVRMVQVTFITVVIVVFFLLVVLAVLHFFYRRAKNRNELIAKAIENNYQLPEVFYNPSSDRGWSVDIKYDNTAKNDNETVGVVEDSTENAPQPSQPIPPVYRKTRNFENGWRNVAIGIGFAIIFTVWEARAVAVIGIIPLMIGAGQLLTYYNIIKK